MWTTQFKCLVLPLISGKYIDNLFFILDEISSVFFSFFLSKVSQVISILAKTVGIFIFVLVSSGICITTGRPSPGVESRTRYVSHALFSIYVGPTWQVMCHPKVALVTRVEKFLWCN